MKRTNARDSQFPDDEDRDGPKTLVYSLLNHLIQLLSTENFIKEYSTLKELKIRSKT
jgi:hypothetical protein